MAKYPKSIGACADLLHDMREKRLAADKVAAALKSEETALIDHIINNLDKDSTGAAGKRYRAQVREKQKLRINPEKWSDFYAWVKKNNAFDCLQKRLSEEAIAARLADKKKVPGVETFIAKTVSLTKV